MAGSERPNLALCQQIMPRPMEKPDPHGDWVLFQTRGDQGATAPALDEDLLAAARNAWPRVLGHARGELLDKAPGHERKALAAQVWERVLRSVAKTRLRGGDDHPPIADLESYLIGVFHHRFNRLLRQEQRRSETIELVASVAELEQFDAALDTRWAEQLERHIAARQITSRMNPWTKKVWLARQLNYSWKTIGGWLGITEQQAKMKYYYNLEKIRQAILRELKHRTPKKTE